MGHRKRERLSVLLDWATVEYRTVWLALAGLAAVAVAVCGGIWWMHGTERREAQFEIQRAESLREEASTYVRGERLSHILQASDGKLDEARVHFANRDFSDARTSAIVSQNTSQQLIDMARGESTTRSEVRFYKIEGEVRVKRAGQFHWEPADSKMFLRIGDQVKTSEGSGAQIIYFDGSITTIKPGSLLEIKDLYNEPGTRAKRVAEKLNWGEVEASTRRQDAAGSFHEVSTDSAVARSSDDAQFLIRNEQDSNVSEVTLFNGKLDLTAGGARVALSDRERVKVRDGTMGEVERLPMIPRLISPPDQKVFTYPDPSAAQTTLVWERIPEAVSYRLQISTRPMFTQTLVDSDKVRSTSVELSGLQSAGYYWRVFAIDEQGRVGPPSPPRKFRIMRAQLNERADVVPPRLKIQDFVQNGEVVIINGLTEPGVTLWVDNERVDVDDQGGFSTVVRLRREGINKIKLSAQDAAGNESSQSLQAVVETF